VVLATHRRGLVVHLSLRLEDGTELNAVTTDLRHPRTGDRVSVDIDPSAIVPLGDDPPERPI
jgi:hypothetical protein